MTQPAYADLPNGVRVRWHIGFLGPIDECYDASCPYPHATKEQLQKGMEWPQSS